MQTADDAERGFHCAVAKRRRGVLLGADEGDERAAEDDAWLRAEGVENPTRRIEVALPGFDGGTSGAALREA